MNEQSPSGTKQTRNGVASDDKSKDLNVEQQIADNDVDSNEARNKSGVASDDKSKGFNA
jgi:hypothetical protein